MKKSARVGGPDRNQIFAHSFIFSITESHDTFMSKFRPVKRQKDLVIFPEFTQYFYCLGVFYTLNFFLLNDTYSLFIVCILYIVYGKVLTKYIRRLFGKNTETAYFSEISCFGIISERRNKKTTRKLGILIFLSF